MDPSKDEVSSESTQESFETESRNDDAPSNNLERDDKYGSEENKNNQGHNDSNFESPDISDEQVMEEWNDEPPVVDDEQEEEIDVNH